jgi:L-fuconolactonase
LDGPGRHHGFDYLQRLENRKNMRVDAHQHFWHYTEIDYGWIDDRMQVLRRDFLPDDLAPLLQEHGIDVSVAVQARQSDEETRWLLELAGVSQVVGGVVGWIDLRSPELEQMLSKYLGNAWLKGFRHVLQDEPDDAFMLQTDFVSGVATLAAHDFSYDILVFERQLGSVRSLVAELPEMRLVIDHIAKPDILNDSWQSWADHMAALAKHAHLHCKLSGMVTEADWAGWTPATFERYIAHVIDCFGAERIMFGSDWPVCTVAASYSQVVDIVGDIVRQRWPEAQDDIFGATAARFYRLV